MSSNLPNSCLLSKSRECGGGDMHTNRQIGVVEETKEVAEVKLNHRTDPSSSYNSNPPYSSHPVHFDLDMCLVVLCCAQEM